MLYSSSHHFVKFPNNFDFEWKIPLKNRIDGNYEPNVYIIKEVSTGKIYIGSRTRKNCKDSDIGNTYFTSCNEIGTFWELDRTLFEIVDVFKCESNRSALAFESFLIDETNAVKDPEFFNRTNRGANFNTSGILRSSKSQEKYVYTIKTSFGLIETTTNLAQYCRDNCLNERHMHSGGYKGYVLLSKKLKEKEIEYRRTLSESKEKYIYTIQNENGEIERTTNLKRYCEDRGMSPSNMRNNGKYKGSILLNKKLIKSNFRTFLP